MKYLTYCIVLLSWYTATAQSPGGAGNIFIITTDGFRWQEIFNGADSALLFDVNCVKDTSVLKQLYWDASPEQRRQKLLPFFWNVIAKQGQLYGNRQYNNKVNVSNFYKISYPGYSEILTGFADWRLIPNTPVKNRRTNVLEYLNKQDAYKGRVVAFSSWNIMPYILNEQRSGFEVNSGYETLGDTDSASQLINQVQNNVAVKNNTRHDMLTYLSAREYLVQHHPKVLFLSLGETDEYAHHGRYDLYLQKAADVDRMLSELWYFVQTDPFYKNNTTFIISTDHGRGKKGDAWKGHGFWVKGSGEIWLAMLGPGIAPMGEMKNEQQAWQKQIAPTAAQLIGEHFEAAHAVSKPLHLPENTHQLLAADK